MSHRATNWAFDLRGLKPSAKIVLLVLADCHNPEHGCFPTQAFLADACEMNRDTVNVQLALLEERGLIRRVRSIDPVSKRKRPTRYKLAFEADFEGDGDDDPAPSRVGAAANSAEKPVSEMPTQTPEAVSEIPAEPCRKYGQSRVGNSDINYVKERKTACLFPPARFRRISLYSDRGAAGAVRLRWRKTCGLTKEPVENHVLAALPHTPPLASKSSGNFIRGRETGRGLRGCSVKRWRAVHPLRSSSRPLSASGRRMPGTSPSMWPMPTTGSISDVGRITRRRSL